MVILIYDNTRLKMMQLLHSREAGRAVGYITLWWFGYDSNILGALEGEPEPLKPNLILEIEVFNCFK